MITVGCAGFPVPATRYFKYFFFVEIQETHSGIPGQGTLRRWQREAPEGFRFSLMGPREIGQEGFREGKVVETGVSTIEGISSELGAESVVFVTPPEFVSTKTNKLILKDFFRNIHNRFSQIIYEPGPEWDINECEGMASEFGVIVSRDPLTQGLSKMTKGYYRLHGPAGHKSRYEDPAIDKLADLAASVENQEAVYVFTNVDMFADARRFKKALKM